jgi:hypothetical protein
LRQRVLWHTQHTSAYVSIRAAYVSDLAQPPPALLQRVLWHTQHTSAYVSIRAAYAISRSRRLPCCNASLTPPRAQHTLAYVQHTIRSLRQHMCIIRQNTLNPPALSAPSSSSPSVVASAAYPAAARRCCCNAPPPAPLAPSPSAWSLKSRFCWC